MEFYSLQSLHDFFSPVQLFLCCVDCWHKFLCPQPANTALFILPSFPVPNPLCTISGDVPRCRTELSSLLGHSSILLGLTKNPTGISHLKSEFNVHKCTLHNLQNITFSEIKIRTINVLDCHTPPHLWLYQFLSSFTPPWNAQMICSQNPYYSPTWIISCLLISGLSFVKRNENLKVEINCQRKLILCFD